MPIRYKGEAPIKASAYTYYDRLELRDAGFTYAYDYPETVCWIEEESEQWSFLGEGRRYLYLGFNPHGYSQYDHIARDYQC